MDPLLVLKIISLGMNLVSTVADAKARIAEVQAAVETGDPAALDALLEKVMAEAEELGST